MRERPEHKIMAERKYEDTFGRIADKLNNILLALAFKG